jgi:microcystin-dependent protein
MSALLGLRLLPLAVLSPQNHRVLRRFFGLQSGVALRFPPQSKTLWWRLRRAMLLVFFGFFGGQAPAQSVPALINYQGQLTDANGTDLATADYILTFRIYGSETGTDLIWGPQMFDGVGGQGHGAKVPVVHGFFNVLLGQWDTAGRSLATAFDGTDRYVEVQLGGNAAIKPRQRILTAPFAFEANSPEKLVVPGGSSTTAVAVDSGGNIGIGTSAPNKELVVARNTAGSVCNLALDGDNGAGDGGSGILFRYNGAVKWHVFERNQEPYHALAFSTGEGAYNSSVLTLLRNGNVGIGTTVPQRTFHVHGNGVRVTGVNPAISFDPDGTGVDHASLGAATLDGGGLSGARPNDTILTGRSTGNLLFGVGFTERMRISSSGNVGIGTTTPGAKLDVNGAVKATTLYSGDRKVSDFGPAGMIVAFGGANPPDGWLPCDGAAVSRTTYSNLLAAISETWGAGNGSSTFNVPDLRGVFLRGVNGTRSGEYADPGDSRTGGNSVGSFQPDGSKSHNHTVSVAKNPGSTDGQGWPSVNAHLSLQSSDHFANINGG